MKTLILTDNPFALMVAQDLQRHFGDIDICQSPKGELESIARIDVTKKEEAIIDKYNLAIAIHCKQLFPATLIKAVRCINVHPGFNPYNRGWFPQVFSIINGLPAGVTIHEMDEQLDHGPIIVQEKCTIETWDTSESVYLKILQLEKKLLMEYYEKIVYKKYTAYSPVSEGNINLKKDFKEICKIDLDQSGTFRQFLNLLRALSHGKFNNAYFLDTANQRVFVRVILEREDQRKEKL